MRFFFRVPNRRASAQRLRSEPRPGRCADDSLPNPALEPASARTFEHIPTSRGCCVVLVDRESHGSASPPLSLLLVTTDGPEEAKSSHRGRRSFVHESKKSGKTARVDRTRCSSPTRAQRGGGRPGLDPGAKCDLEKRLALLGRETANGFAPCTARANIDRIVDVSRRGKGMSAHDLVVRPRTSRKPAQTRTAAGRRRARDHGRNSGDPQPSLENKMRRCTATIRRPAGMQRSTIPSVLVKRNIVAIAEARSKAANKDNFAG